MSTEVRTSNQSRASTKIVIGFVLLVALAWVGKWAYTRYSIGNKTFPPLAPGRVNLVGVDTSKGGYRIVVANGIAQLVISTQEEGLHEAGSDNSDSDTGSDDSSKKKRIPLKEMIQALEGNSAAIDPFVRKLNDITDEDLPSVVVNWTADDIRKAISKPGDPALRAKLEKDLNVHLDGTPLKEFYPRNFQRGIVILLPASLSVPTAQGRRVITGQVQFPFESLLMKALEERVQDIANLTDQSLAGYYGEVSQTFLKDPMKRENLAEVLDNAISERHTQQLTALPQKMMESIEILANESLITHASYSPEDTPKGKVFNMNVDLVPEGRDRLWKYSTGASKVGSQLLLVVNGVAIAAPKIGTELAQTNLTISNLPDESLVREAVDGINSVKGNSNTQ